MAERELARASHLAEDLTAYMRDRAAGAGARAT